MKKTDLERLKGLKLTNAQKLADIQKRARTSGAAGASTGAAKQSRLFNALLENAGVLPEPNPKHT